MWKSYDVFMKSVLKHNHAFLIALLPLPFLFCEENNISWPFKRSVFEQFVGLKFKGLKRFC